jgi:hypothetical protein
VSKGVLFFAKNNEQLNYAKQANISSLLVKKHMNLPTAVVVGDKLTNSYIEQSLFDEVIQLEAWSGEARRAYDGGLNPVTFTYYNSNRPSAYEISPFKQTLLLDTDYLVQNSSLNALFETDYPFAANQASFKGNGEAEDIKEKCLHNGGPSIMWATALYFSKSQYAADLFYMVKLIQEYWEHYRWVFNLPNRNYRNDFAFAMAAHILADHRHPDIPALPSPQINVYVPDKLINIRQSALTFDNGFTPFRLKGQNVHFMNKWNLEENYNKIMEVYGEGL